MNQFWFMPKLKGYGATPTTWEGHTLVAVFASVVIVCVLAMRGRKKTSSIFPLPMIVVAVSTIIFLIVCAWKTDGAWG